MTMRIRKVTIPQLVADASGNAVETSGQTVTGEILRVKADYSASSHSNTDLTITDADGKTIVSRANNKTDFDDNVRDTAKDYQGTDLHYEGTNKIAVPFVVNSILTATVADNTEDETVDVEVWVREK